ncbi:hypothetical protein [Bradyrhizobium sp. TM233]|uniref:hypothetical protein n=1 Tax=Bradyrhizobium sp. TM233 TaxID=2599801 RepID=UPI0027D4E6F4|nr:hypothetical protein TM233_61100 [Bradyrhizobium sp. TM233]
MKRVMNIISKDGRALWVGVCETRDEAIAALIRDIVVEDQQCARCETALATRWYQDVTDNDGTGNLEVPVCDECFKATLVVVDSNS